MVHIKKILKKGRMVDEAVDRVRGHIMKALTGTVRILDFILNMTESHAVGAGLRLEGEECHS